ncbi:MAG TPA: tetratricopeptide repeat protein [Caldithrix abyssi]|uniref:Tetratricopeptide repeat protein n=1 Tax=Caldithrix abyssi TaxID=187145 RepID=A0A7V4WWI6_CALAY|nr:tetratricopeptide repeat protein [Caldithrix abyssi]
MSDLNIWKRLGLMATIIIVLSVPIYLFKFYLIEQTARDKNTIEKAVFVGREQCVECHKKEYDLWHGSDHDLAMDVANDSTVLGNFNNATFTGNGFISRFYRKDGKFYVYTLGPDGKPGDFQITHTFGVRPLQQYLVPFDKGRLQCLSIAWDSDRNQWFDLAGMVYQEERPDAHDWLYWTNAGQNWNGMCAECHSTGLRKNYSAKADSFHTTWFEIDVSCEACHGPSSQHVQWANLPETARPDDVNYGLLIRTSNVTNRSQVDLCAPCHARRSSLGNLEHRPKALLDQVVPQLLLEPYYFADGQILEEDYVYGSFTQSKMYMKDVRCSDCHDVHSGKRVKEDNTLCLQCHRADQYDRYSHHFHKKAGEEGRPLIMPDGKKVEVGQGALCVNCHMPGRYYMGIDFRRDHSLRIPRPDLSLKIGTPNACNQCHEDKSTQWAVDAVVKWYGEQFTRRPHFGTVFYAAQRNDSSAVDDLIRISNDPLFPPIVRATAVSLLGRFPSAKSHAAIIAALNDAEELIRHTAVIAFLPEDRSDMINALAPFLQDRVKAVRIAAANRLSALPPESIPERLRQAYRSALVEYEQSQLYAADFPAGRFNLGNLYNNLGQPDRAAAQYEAAIRIDDKFFPAKMNLAVLYNRLGKNDRAEALLRQVIKQNPDMSEAYYSLGLLLAEKKDYTAAAGYLQTAARRMPRRARIHYNLGLILQHLNRFKGAEESLRTASLLEPYNPDYLYALADFYIKTNQFGKAKTVAERMLRSNPSNKMVREMLAYIKKQLNSVNKK